MPFRKNDFIKTMGVITGGFIIIAFILFYAAPEKWYNDAMRVGLAISMLVIAMSALVAHHVTLEVDRLIESINNGGERT